MLGMDPNQNLSHITSAKEMEFTLSAMVLAGRIFFGKPHISAIVTPPGHTSVSQMQVYWTELCVMLANPLKTCADWLAWQERLEVHQLFTSLSGFSSMADQLLHQISYFTRQSSHPFSPLRPWWMLSLLMRLISKLSYTLLAPSQSAPNPTQLHRRPLVDVPVYMHCRKHGHLV